MFECSKWRNNSHLTLVLPAGTVKHGSALWFFGTFEMACLRPAEIVTLEEGLQKGLHASCKRSVKLFRAALQQVHRYLKVTSFQYEVSTWLFLNFIAYVMSCTFQWRHVDLLSPYQRLKQQ